MDMNNSDRIRVKKGGSVHYIKYWLQHCLMCLYISSVTGSVLLWIH